MSERDIDNMSQFGGDNSIYEDTRDFISYIYEDYDFYKNLVRMFDQGQAETVIIKNVLQKNIDELWVSSIEKALPYLDTAMRTTRKDIKEVEEIKPIELSRNITAKSLQHLATHTHFIDSIDEKGNIIPNRILNIYKDEELHTYENKFINTLINRLGIFIDSRYRKLEEHGADEVSNRMALDISTKIMDTRVNMQLSIETVDSSDDKEVEGNINMFEDMSKTSLWQRVQRIRKIVQQYQGSAFIKEMGKSYIRPPVMRTNMIMKNIHLRECLELWLFIESYESAGFDVESSAVREKPNDELMEYLFKLMAFQYVFFRKNSTDSVDDIISKSRARLKYNARFKKLNLREFTDEYEYLNPNVKKIYVDELSRRNTKLTKEELKLRKAIENALKSESAYAAEQRKKERQKSKSRK